MKWRDVFETLGAEPRFAEIMDSIVERRTTMDITPLTRKPITVGEWLENVRSRGGDDAEWAHHILQQARSKQRVSLEDERP